MYLSNGKRLKKVIYQLLLKPQNMPRYFWHILTQPTPLQQKLPWWSYDAIYYLKSLRFESAFEWGSGGSTLFLSKRSKHLTSIENDEGWYELLKQKLSSNQNSNITLLKRKIDLSSPENFIRSEYLNSLDKKYDFISIDGEDHFGPDSFWSARIHCFERAQSWINPKGIIVVDDSWRYPEITSKSHANMILECEGLGPSRKGVTKTDIHIY